MAAARSMSFENKASLITQLSGGHLVLSGIGAEERAHSRILK